MKKLWLGIGSGLLLAACGPGAASTDSDEAEASFADLRSRVRVTEVDLVSDRAGAAKQDAQLLNPWGIAFSPAGAWVANNHSATATVYDSTGRLVTTVPFPKTMGADASPTGQVYNSVATHFRGDQFIFCGEDGRVYGWQHGSVVVRADLSASGAIFKGLGLASLPSGDARLYLADFHNGKVLVLDSSYRPVSAAGAFQDERIPAGYAPFNVQWLNGGLFVAYAKQDANAEDDDHGPGFGMIDVFDVNGRLQRRLLAHDHLNSPWGMAVAPPSFGALAGKLLVGNFGDGRINIYDLHGGSETAVSYGSLLSRSGQPVTLDGLWALATSPDGKLYFTAATTAEDHGLFGRLEVAY